MTKEDFIKLQELKKQLQLELGSINYSLDIVRASITLITYNLTENDKIKKLPAFDYQKIRKLCSEINSMVAGLSDDYFSANIPGYEKHNPATKPMPKDAIDPNAVAPDKKDKKAVDTYDTFGGVYPSEYANPKSKYYEGDKK